MIDFASAYPNSRKVYEERPVPLTPDGERVTLRVPVREVALSGGEPSIRLYDTSSAFQCTVNDPRWRPRPSPLAILRERLFLNSGSN